MQSSKLQLQLPPDLAERLARHCRVSRETEEHAIECTIALYLEDRARTQARYSLAERIADGIAELRASLDEWHHSQPAQDQDPELSDLVCEIAEYVAPVVASEILDCLAEQLHLAWATPAALPAELNPLRLAQCNCYEAIAQALYEAYEAMDSSDQGSG